MAERPQEIEQIERICAAAPVVRQEMECVVDLLDRQVIDKNSREEVKLQAAGLRAMMDFATFCLEGGSLSLLLQITRDRAEQLANGNYDSLAEEFNFSDFLQGTR